MRWGPITSCAVFISVSTGLIPCWGRTYHFLKKNVDPDHVASNEAIWSE